MKHLYSVLAVLLALGLLMPQSTLSQDLQVIQSSRHNTSTALRAMQYAPAKTARAPFEIPNKIAKVGGRTDNAADKTGFVDPVHQQILGTLAPSIGANFEGSSDDDNAAQLGFRLVPPDTEGDVGPNHYLQWINSVTEIFDKDGNTIFGPTAGNVYFQGLGGDCESNNNGDPVVLYDELADRWLVSQFAVNASPYSMCVAISQTSDPTGAYHQYEFDFGSDFPDYPKLAIWGDSYTMTTRDFVNGAFFGGISAIAMDRNAMLNGDPTTMVRFDNAFGGTFIDGYLPADADGAISGPPLFGGHGDDGDTTFELWELDVDWSNPGAASFNSIPGVGISSFDGVAPDANQPNGQGLADLSFFTMHRLHVRDFGGHTSMVANHTVEVSVGVLGIRWYEFRNTGGNWTLHQEGTFSPDSDDRWMGSIAINAAGDISLGYSRSSSSMFPSIYFTGQTADQSGSGVMNVAETEIFAGSGSQEGANRWGDYSMMSVDPSDDSFWFTTEYYAETASFDFKTRIASFVLDDEPGNNPPVADFTFSCTDLSCDFTDASTDSDGSITDWEWDFGDGSSSTAQNPGHVFAAAGTYSVTLMVTDDQGDSDSITKDVSVSEPGGNAPPAASFTSACTLLSCDFTDTSTDSDGTIVSWDWDFGDGNTSTEQNPSHTYAAASTYTVSLAVTDNEGDSDTATEEVTVTDGTGGAALHVAGLRLGKQKAGGALRNGKATVTIHDENGAVFEGATVFGIFSGAFEAEEQMDVTDKRGRAILVSDGTFRIKDFSKLEFCVSDIVADDFIYDPTANGDPSWDCGDTAATEHDLTDSNRFENLQGVPEAFVLDQNYPNPFNPTTMITFGLPESGHVSIKVYNLLGQEIAILVNEVRDAGQHTVSFNANDLSAGVYMYVMETADFTTTKRMTLLK